MNDKKILIAIQEENRILAKEIIIENESEYESSLLLFKDNEVLDMIRLECKTHKDVETLNDYAEDELIDKIYLNKDGKWFICDASMKLFSKDFEYDNLQDHLLKSKQDIYLPLKEELFKEGMSR